MSTTPGGVSAARRSAGERTRRHGRGAPRVRRPETAGEDDPRCYGTCRCSGIITTRRFARRRGRLRRCRYRGRCPPTLGSHAPAELARRRHSTTRGEFPPSHPAAQTGTGHDRGRPCWIARRVKEGRRVRCVRGKRSRRGDGGGGDRSTEASRKRASRAIKRRFVEARLFAVNAKLRETATRARRVAASAARRVEERDAAKRAEDARREEDGGEEKSAGTLLEKRTRKAKETRDHRRRRRRTWATTSTLMDVRVVESRETRTRSFSAFASFFQNKTSARNSSRAPLGLSAVRRVPGRRRSSGSVAFQSLAPSSPTAISRISSKTPPRERRP